MQLLIFSFVYDSRRLLIKSRLHPFGLVGSNGLFYIWLLRNQVLHPFAPTLFPRVWWAQMDSDHRPHAYQACALTS